MRGWDRTQSEEWAKEPPRFHKCVAFVSLSMGLCVGVLMGVIF